MALCLAIRYDKLIYLVWRRFWPRSLNNLLFFVGVNCFITNILSFVKVFNILNQFLCNHSNVAEVVLLN